MVLPSPRYGLNDIIVCERPQRLKVDSRIIISRIVGLAGDVVEIRQHHLWRNHQPVSERFVTSPMKDDFAPIKVRPGEYFVLGDNRDDSYDSRYWGGVPKGNVRFKVLRLYWSSDLRRIGLPLR